MSRKTGRIAGLVVTLAAFGAMSLAAASASAQIVCSGPCLRITPTFTNWVVSGSLTAKTFSQKVTLPEGSTFNGKGEIIIENPTGTREVVNGTITGNVFVPPFNAVLTLPINEIPTPTNVGIKFSQVGQAVGTVAPATGCTEEFSCVTTTVPTKANVGFTVVGILGIQVPTHCETSKPIQLELKGAPQTLLEVVTKGLHFTGETTIPPIKCEGLEGLLLAPVMTAALSGPNNPYALAITPPAPPPAE
jgi:hypothetical protein